MKISKSIPALLFLTGMMCLFFSSCTDEESERGTLVPLRLSMTIPAAEGSVTTRAGETGKFNIALSTSKGFAEISKVYTTSSAGTSSVALTSTDPLMISRLFTTTPLTLYGTYQHPTLGYQPVYYSNSTNIVEGAVTIQPQLANAIIVVNSGNNETYKVNIKNIEAPIIDNNNLYQWYTGGSKPSLQSGSSYPVEFETSTITTPEQLAGNSGKYASIIPYKVAKGASIMQITEYNTIDDTRGDTYTVKAPDDITFEANKCYFITLNVNAEKEVTMTVNITPMTIEKIKLRTDPGIYDLQDLEDFRDAWNNNDGSLGIGGGVYDKWMKLDGYTYIVNLYADIDLKDKEWVPIDGLSGITFEGNDHKLLNLRQSTINSHFGLFTIIEDAEVKNLTIDGAHIGDANNDAQVFAYVMSKGLISNCHVKNANLTGDNVYGFVGQALNDCKIEGCSISNSSLVATSSAAGITSDALSYATNSEITTCSVSDCKINGQSGNSSIASPQGIITITACIASDIQLSTTNNAIADGAVNGCYFANVTAGGAKIDSGDGYLVTPTDLETDYINNKLNNTIYNKDYSFPFKYESGKIVKGSPSETTSFPKGIYTATHLVDCGKNPASYAEGDFINLYDDIDMQDVSYTPMGSVSSTADYSFKGNNHKISNLNAAGLYSETSVKKAVSIENLIMVNPTFFGETAAGCGLVAFGSYKPLTFTNCQILGGSSNGAADGYAGGLVGGSTSENLIINNCLVSGMSKIEADQAGGFIGLSNGKTTIKQSAVRNIGLLKGGYIGSFVGMEMQNGSEYKSCIAEKIKGEASYYFGFAAGSYLGNTTLTGILYYNVPNATEGENAEAKLTKINCQKVNYGFGTNHATVLNNADTDGKWFYDYNTYLVTQENWVSGY